MIGLQHPRHHSEETIPCHGAPALAGRAAFALVTGINKTTDAVTLTYDPWGRARLDDAVGELEWMVQQNQCSPSAGVPET